MYELTTLLRKKVRVITTDARLFEGVLEGSDKQSNLVLGHCIERVVGGGDYQQLELGVYFLRGGMVVCVGEIDDKEDINWKNVTGEKLRDTKNPL